MPKGMVFEPFGLKTGIGNAGFCIGFDNFGLKLDMFYLLV